MPSLMSEVSLHYSLEVSLPHPPVVGHPLAFPLVVSHPSSHLDRVHFRLGLAATRARDVTPPPHGNWIPETVPAEDDDL